jgi:redox-sensitive bicupin YhaK (pirin superfamily)
MSDYRASLISALALATLICGANFAHAQELRLLEPEAVLALPGNVADDGLTRRPLAQTDDVIVVRASLPANADIPAHAHPAGKVALVTVLSGNIELGLGETFDETKLQMVPVGGMAVFRENDPMHFARSGPEGAEILVVAVPPAAVEEIVLQEP